MQIFLSYRKFSFYLILALAVILNSCNPNNNAIFQSEQFCVYPNRIVQGNYTAIAKDETLLISTYPIEKNIAESSWKLSTQLNQYPKYESNYKILNAVYNLSLEELANKIMGDTILVSSELNTKDLGYATILSLALICPEVCRQSLMQRVKNNRIIQDSGTGGSWPVSTDRMLWSVAAWEIYKITGDNDWLRKAYFIIKNSTEDDLDVIWDYKKHLFRGESTFLNWREQSYPDWMEPIDIYETYSLSTQMVHYQSLLSLIKMGELLDKDIQKYKHVSDALKNSINKHFGTNGNQHPGRFIYKSQHLISDKRDLLGESLGTIWHITKFQKQDNYLPVFTDFGVPCIDTQSHNLPNYHNNCIWPFVQSFWNWAFAKKRNIERVRRGLVNSLRSTALFLTNKSNFLIETGDFKGTEQNADSDLKSIAGSLSNYYRVLLGLNYTAQHLEITPTIPRELKGKQVLSGLKYRNAILDIEILGFGNQINSFTFDGTPYQKAIVPKDIEGYHKIVIKMNNQVSKNEKTAFNKPQAIPGTPVLSLKKDQLQWNKIPGAAHYKIYQNGELLLKTKDTYMADVYFTEPVKFHIQAVDSLNNHSFLSKPLILYKSKYEKLLEAESFLQKQKTNYVLLRKKDKTPYFFQVKAPRDGKYQISFLYANGNGAIDNGSKCVTRSLWFNNSYLGSIVFPQRGKLNWNDYGYSNSFTIDLKKGYNFFKISFEDFNNNMSWETNSVRIDKIRLIRIH